MNNRNAGLSLIELVVTIAIISVLMGIGIISVGMLSSREAKKTCSNLKTTIENSRLDALSKEKMTLVIWQDSNGVHYKETTRTGAMPEIQNVGTIGNSNVLVQLEKADGSIVDLGHDDASGQVFKFKRDTGGFSDNTDVSPTVPFDIVKIHVSKAGKTYSLKLQRFTGRVIAE